jgi:hypothetical protein
MGRSARGEDPLKTVKIVTVVVLCAGAVGLLGWQVSTMFRGPLVLEDADASPEVVEMKEDLALLAALDLPQLQAEVAQRERAMREAGQRGNSDAYMKAMMAFERAREELTHRDAK